MSDLKDIKRSLTQEKPAEWETLPDIDLYMDQVLSYMKRQLMSERPESQLTSAMVNNYIKAGVLHRTKGKRYSRSHIAKLTSVCALKSVLSVKDIYTLFRTFDTDSSEDGYKKFRIDLIDGFAAAAEKIPDEMNDNELASLAIEFAISSYVNKVACEKLIDLMRELPTNNDLKNDD